MAIDVGIQAALGNFFAARFRAGVLFAIHERTGDRIALEEALKTYRSARDIWAKMAESARSVYVADVTVGELAWLRGHWTDRLPAIDADIANMAKRLDVATVQTPAAAHAKAAITAALAVPARGSIACSHTPEPHLRDKEPLYVELKAPQTGSARLWYRHFNQAERWQTVEMLPLPDSDRFRASIDASFTQSPYPVQYYFEVRLQPGKGVAVSGLRCLARQSALLFSATAVRKIADTAHTLDKISPTSNAELVSIDSLQIGIHGHTTLAFGIMPELRSRSYGCSIQPKISRIWINGAASTFGT